jgi:hypothetical protein
MNGFFCFASIFWARLDAFNHAGMKKTKSDGFQNSKIIVGKT